MQQLKSNYFKILKYEHTLKSERVIFSTQCLAVRTWCNVIKDPEHSGCPDDILKRQIWKGNSPKMKILFSSTIP
jgi:hypothetical protein